MILRFSIPGEPAPKGSRTSGVRKDGSVYTRPASAREKPWLDQASRALWAQAAEQKTCFGSSPVRVTVRFLCGRPKRPVYDWPTRGDVDKFARLALDALVRGAVIADDRHVVELVASKAFAAEPQTVGTVELADVPSLGPALAVVA